MLPREEKIHLAWRAYSKRPHGIKYYIALVELVTKALIFFSILDNDIDRMKKEPATFTVADRMQSSSNSACILQLRRRLCKLPR
jgi:hypothetical protein